MAKAPTVVKITNATEAHANRQAIAQDPRLQAEMAWKQNACKTLAEATQAYLQSIDDFIDALDPKDAVCQNVAKYRGVLQGGVLNPLLSELPPPPAPPAPPAV